MPQAMHCADSCKALREQMQSFALADAKLCVGSCKALRWQLQSFALADAMLCVRVGPYGSLILQEISTAP